MSGVGAVLRMAEELQCMPDCAAPLIRASGTPHFVFAEAVLAGKCGIQLLEKYAGI